MSFFFKSKRGQQGQQQGQTPQGLPPAARKLSSRDGPPQNTAPTFSQMQADPALINAGGAAPRLGSSAGRAGPSPTPDSKQLNGRPPMMDPAFKGPRMPPQRLPPEASLFPWSNHRLSLPRNTSPFPRYGSSVNCVASTEGEIYMMGGLIDGATVQGDLWVVEAGTLPIQCHEVQTTGNGPGPRVGHASLLVGNALIVFGGDTKVDENDVLDDTLYLLNTASKDWSQAAPAGPRPAGRYGHTLNLIGSKIYLFGGQVEGFFFNDMLSFDLKILQSVHSHWETLLLNTSDGGPPAGQIPPARTNHTVVTFEDRLYLFGGTDGLNWFSDVWCYDPRSNAWAALDCIGYIPTAREGHSAAIVGDVMYVFGGRTEKGEDLGDVAGFRITQRRWYTFQNMGPSPSPRSGHGMSSYGNQIIVFGGEPSSAPRIPVELSDAYILDATKIRYPDDKPGMKTGQTRRPSISDRNGTLQERSASAEGTNASGARNLGTKTSQDSIGPGLNRPLEVAPQAIQQSAQPPRQLRTGTSPVPTGPPPQQLPPQPKVNGLRAGPSPYEAGAVNKAERALAAQALVPSYGQGPTSEPYADTGYDSRQEQPHQKQASLDSISNGPVVPEAHTSASDDYSKQRSYADSGFGSSPALSTQQQDGLAKELDTLRNRNAWYASELALARKAGYRSSTDENSAVLLGDRISDSFGDDEKPLVEALIKMKSELVKVQDALASQSAAAADRMARVEHEKQIALAEALHAKTQIASRDSGALGISVPSDDAGRRLTAALAVQSELQNKIDSLSVALEAERKARELAEDSANHSHARATELDTHKQQSMLQLETMKGELHQAQALVREHASSNSEVLSSSRMLEVEKQELTAKLAAADEQHSKHTTVLAALHQAMTASTTKADQLEQQIEQERQQRVSAEEKLQQLKSEHEAHIVELESTSRRLRDVEQLAEIHATEARTHRDAVLAGLTQLSTTSAATPVIADERVAALEQNLVDAQALAQQHKDAADGAASKLRSAEERIAGLESYQEQSSRESLNLRKQLQTMSKDAISLQTGHSELQQQLSQHKLDLASSSAQHQMLRTVLADRGIDASSLPKNLDEYQLHTGNAKRLQQLEEQIEASARAQEDMRQAFEKREQEVRRSRDTEYLALEKECQQMREYIEGFHDVAEKLKKSIKKEKAENVTLREELDKEKHGAAAASTKEVSAVQASFQTEKADLLTQINSLQTRVSAAEADLDTQLRHLKTTMMERDSLREDSNRLQKQIAESSVKSQADIESLRHHNTQLETRAVAAEKQVRTLLDSVGSSVDNYRRQSQHIATSQVNGFVPGHSRGVSAASIGAASAASMHSKSNSISNGQQSSVLETTPHAADRTSAVLDSFAAELDNLRRNWENTKSMSLNRLSDRSMVGLDGAGTATGSEVDPDMEVRALDSTKAGNGSSMVDWRRRLDLDDDDEETEVRDAKQPVKATS